MTKLFYLEGLKRVDVDKAYAGKLYIHTYIKVRQKVLCMYVCMYVCMAGEIVSLAGCAAGVAETVCSVDRFDSSSYTYIHT